MESDKIKMSDIEKIVPVKHYGTSDCILKGKYTEWCLKKYKIDEKIYVTISIQQPNSSKIIYINTKGDQIIYTIDDKYDEYIIEKKYWYGS
jgi:hypothetical protein